MGKALRVGSDVVGAMAGGSVRVPSYERERLTGGITHLGVGGFHRAHLAVYIDDLAEKGGRWSITGSGLMDHDRRMVEVLQRQDHYYLLAEREGETANCRIIGALTKTIAATTQTQELIHNLVDPTTQIVSLTITESGYPVEHGAFVPSETMAADCVSDQPVTTFGVLVAALDARRKSGAAPFTVLSCDNLPGNGHVARHAVSGAAALRSEALAQWVDTHGAFPNAMVDRITPMTTDADRAWVVEKLGIVDEWPVICEPFRQWALEDQFVNGRPEFQNVGVLMTDDVIPYEHMKLRLLNGSHSAVAYHAALAGIHYVHDAVLDVRIQKFMRTLMKAEVAPNLLAPAGINLAEYQDQLVSRFSNPAIADTIGRLCMDGTSKFPTFIVPSLEDQLDNGGSIRMLALVLAGWCRYLRGVRDDGSALSLSHDPFLQEARQAAERSVHDPRAFLHYEKGLGPNLAKSDRLLEVFTEALHSMDNIGSLATLDQWTVPL
jgi:mannitol 2-dehydrogenase